MSWNDESVPRASNTLSDAPLASVESIAPARDAAPEDETQSLRHRRHSFPALCWSTEDIAEVAVEATQCHPSWGPRRICRELRRTFGTAAPSPRSIALALRLVAGSMTSPSISKASRTAQENDGAA
jgi:hypothetical protein